MMGKLLSAWRVSLRGLFVVCDKCADYGWVCEDHPDKPWESGTPSDCKCGGAGAPCECTKVA